MLSRTTRALNYWMIFAHDTQKSKDANDAKAQYAHWKKYNYYSHMLDLTSKVRCSDLFMPSQLFQLFCVQRCRGVPCWHGSWLLPHVNFATLALIVRDRKHSHLYLICSHCPAYDEFKKSYNGLNGPTFVTAWKHVASSHSRITSWRVLDVCQYMLTPPLASSLLVGHLTFAPANSQMR